MVHSICSKSTWKAKFTVGIDYSKHLKDFSHVTLGIAGGQNERNANNFKNFVITHLLLAMVNGSSFRFLEVNSSHPLSLARVKLPSGLSRYIV
jgi:hypothetical protein